MTKTTHSKTQRIKTAKPAKLPATDRTYRQMAKTLRPSTEFNNRWINFAALRFCALALNSK